MMSLKTIYFIIYINFLLDNSLDLSYFFFFFWIEIFLFQPVSRDTRGQTVMWNALPYLWSELSITMQLYWKKTVIIETVAIVRKEVNRSHLMRAVLGYNHEPYIAYNFFKVLEYSNIIIRDLLGNMMIHGLTCLKQNFANNIFNIFRKKQR